MDQAIALRRVQESALVGDVGGQRNIDRPAEVERSAVLAIRAAMHGHPHAQMQRLARRWQHAPAPGARPIGPGGVGGHGGSLNGGEAVTC